MDDDLPLPTILLLHGDATALDRVAQHNRRALRNSLAETAAPHRRNKTAPAEPAVDPVADARHEDAVIANLEQTKQRVAEAQSRLQNHAAEPTPTEAPTAASTPAPTQSRSLTAKPSPAAVPAITDRERQTLWAAAMTEVAAEYTASLPHLPATERKLASRRVAALSSTANSLLCGSVPAAPQPAARDPGARHTGNIHKRR
jgi:hypothetical protein